jgi:transcriptional regulator with XRE-family HTH domain
MGLTQQALAAKAGNQQSRISDIERGLESLTREEVSAIGAALGDSERAIEIWIRPPNAPPVAPSISDEETRLLAAYRAVASGEVRAFLLRMVESAGQTDEPAAA